MAAGDLRKLLAVGAGIGIEIGEHDLRITVARVRPSGARVIASATIAGFRERPAAEWGKVYADFIKRSGAGHLSAAVLLPRRDVIVRQLSLPGLSSADLDSAIRLQIDSLHPFPEEDAVYGWARVGSSGSVLVAIARREVLSGYVELFGEAGVRISSFTVSAAAVYSAVRLITTPRRAFVAWVECDGVIEAYGESDSKPFFSAAFDAPVERAAALAAAELRIEPGGEPAELSAVLPRPVAAPADYDLSRNALAYAAALAGACGRLSLPVNLLPAESRSTNSRMMYVPTIALAILLALSVLALGSISPIEDRKYLASLRAEIAKLEPQASRAAVLDRAIDAAKARSRSIDLFHWRSKAGMDALAELTKILEPPAYLTSLELSRDSVTLAGQAEQAAPLLKLLDDSPLFGGSKFTMQLARNGKFEVFRIRSDRKGPQ